MDGLDEARQQASPLENQLLDALQASEQTLDLDEAICYFEFPLYRDDEQGVVSSRVTIASRHHGILVFAASTASEDRQGDDLASTDNLLDQIASLIESRLLKNRALRNADRTLLAPVKVAVFCPSYEGAPADSLRAEVVRNSSEVDQFVEGCRIQSLSRPVFEELVSTLEGAKGIIRPKKRDNIDPETYPKGSIVAELEAYIAAFDSEQKRGYMTLSERPMRLRGLAGSGKTVVLAMKAAITHLRNPDAVIAYTFHTKSLYQHVQRLVTRFYRQFDDRDPDWEKLLILHGWGGRYLPGVYSLACGQAGVDAIPFGTATLRAPDSEFDYVCSDLLKSGAIVRSFDYMIVDEGQDFPLSFLKLASAMVKSRRLTYAYDEFQTIFQPKAWAPREVFGEEVDYDDVVLHRCYRNPREILVVAHALGLGIYGRRIVQMPENNAHWEDLGYRVLKGDPVPGTAYEIERPSEYSSNVMSKYIDESPIVHAESFLSIDGEMQWVADKIAEDVTQGLRGDDILVQVVDDRHAKDYLNGIATRLKAQGIETHNIHTKTFDLQDFSKKGAVTLSTVHKAKGNEAFAVYVVGVDALFRPANVRNRNILFTSLTRAKAWVRITGVGNPAEEAIAEIKAALENFPRLVFKYPTEGEFKLMQRDLSIGAAELARIEKALETLNSSGVPPEDLAALLEHLKHNKLSDPVEKAGKLKRARRSRPRD